MSMASAIQLMWPRDIAPDQLRAAMSALVHGGGVPLVVESVGRAHRVEQNILVGQSHRAELPTRLRTAIPGLGIEGRDRSDIDLTAAVEIRTSTRRRPLRTDITEQASKAVLTALAAAGRDEVVALRWHIVERTTARAVPSKIEQLPPETWWKELLAAPFGTPPPADAETRTALRDKHAEHGVRLLGYVAVKAASEVRARMLIRGVLGALRTVEAPGVQLRARRIPPSQMSNPRRRRAWHLNALELAAVAGWPVGSTADQPVVRLGSRRLPPPPSVGRSGRVLGVSTWPGREQQLRLTPNDSLRHLHVIGPTGVGKSTLLLNLIAQDMAAGRSVVVIEPKGDLIRDVLARVPTERINDVVVIDPTDPEAVVGINPVAGSIADRELAADQLLATFHGLYAQHWGPRTSDILHAGLLTLARSDHPTMVGLPILLANPAFRRRLVGKLHDPIGLDAFWAQFDAWSEAERVSAIAPVLNKLRPFLMRPALRRVVGQTSPRFSINSLFTQRKIVLVNVAKGRLGAEAASLLGAMVVSSLWQTAQGRTSIPPERRHPVMVYIDEFQDYLHLPTDLSDALTQARGLGIGFTLAHQHLTQLAPSMRAAVSANARSRVCFQLGSDDAKVFAASSTVLGAEDFTSLDAYHFYAQLVSDGAVGAWTSGRSLAPAAASSGDHASADHVRDTSRRNYATAVAAIDDEVEQLATDRRTTAAASSDDLQPRRRSGGKS